MRVIRREFFNCNKKSKFRIIPLGDIHIGTKACDEKSLKATIKEIKNDPFCYWVGMGDYCEFINMRDPRFAPGALADWIGTKDLTDIAKCQVEYLLGLLKPIAGKCLGLIEGNHETAIKRHSERDVFSSIVTGVKERGGFKLDDRLGFGYTGWLKLAFYRSKKREKVSTITMYLDHGSVGGRLEGAKALHLQRILWNRDCDIALLAHSHNKMILHIARHGIDGGDNFCVSENHGAFTGSFLHSVVDGGSTYSEHKGYYPQAIGQVEIETWPHLADGRKIRIFAR